MIIASAIIAIIVCDPVVNEETSDGYTHTKPVSCVLYNHLYKVVLLCVFYNRYNSDYEAMFRNRCATRQC